MEGEETAYNPTKERKILLTRLEAGRSSLVTVRYKFPEAPFPSRQF